MPRYMRSHHGPRRYKSSCRTIPSSTNHLRRRSTRSPPPAVHSAVIRLTIAPRLDELKVPEAAFIQFLKLSFGQKRKTLWNNLKANYQPATLRAALQKAGVKPTIRAEALSLDKSAALFRALTEREKAGLTPS